MAICLHLKLCRLLTTLLGLLGIREIIKRLGVSICRSLGLELLLKRRGSLFASNLLPNKRIASIGSCLTNELVSSLRVGLGLLPELVRFLSELLLLLCGTSLLSLLI
jgi:hypothetical protein